MAEISDLKFLLDAYGVAVRAGVVTPQTADEEYMRRIMDLPAMSDGVRADWAKTDGVRHPLTIKREGEESPFVRDEDAPPEE